MTNAPELLDAQVHVWEPSHPERPWTTAPPPQTAEPSPFFGGSSVVTDQRMIEMMDEVGVDGALLVTSSRHYGVDNSYAIESAARHPERFRAVVRVDPGDPSQGAQVAAAKRDPSVVGVRLLTMSDADRARFRDGGFDPVFAAATANDLPLCIYPVQTLPWVADAARRFDDLPMVVDHLGLPQRPIARRGTDPFADLPELLALAAYPNVTVKLSGLPTLTWQPFPFADVWPHVHRVLEAFGPERVMWGSDCTRAEGVATYADGVEWITHAGELAEGELAQILGQTLRRVFRWPR
jgi:L-fuconolactonase